MVIFVGLFEHVILAMIYLIAIALDVTLFFVVMRYLATKWPTAFFTRFDAIGSPIVNPILAAANKAGISYRARFIAILLALMVCRLGLGVIANSLITKV